MGNLHRGSSSGYCCQHRCALTAPPDKIREALLNALYTYNAAHTLTIIASFLLLPLDDEKIIAWRSTHNDAIGRHITHASAITVQLYPALPCSSWRKEVSTSNDRKHVYELIKCTCVVFGGAGVGKSALNIRLSANKFLQENEPPEPAIHDSLLDINGQPVSFEFAYTRALHWRSHYSDLTQEHSNIMDGAVALFCFAMNDQETFDLASQRVIKILEHKRSLDSDDREWAIILVATKSDLLYDDEYIASNAQRKYPKRFVDQQVAITFAKENGIAYVETSAKRGTNVRFAFELAFYEWWAQTRARLTQ